MKAKLIKSTKTTKFPRHTGSVAATFRRALDKAQKNSSFSAVIVTRDKGGIDISCSGMSMYEAVGMLERGKHMLMEDNL